jgi:hypothetical protein
VGLPHSAIDEFKTHLSTDLTEGKKAVKTKKTVILEQRGLGMYEIA